MPQDPDNRSALRGLLTAAGTAVGVSAGVGLGSAAGVLSGIPLASRGRKALKHFKVNPIDAPLPHGRGGGTYEILHGATNKAVRSLYLRALLASALGAAGGGVAAYNLSKRKKTAMATKTATREDLLKILKGIGTATAGGAGAGALVGAGIGSVSGKPEGRSRLAQILRSALKGGAVGGGLTAGALGGGLGAGKAMKGIGEGAGMSAGTTNKLTAGATLGGALAGAGAGGALGAKLGAEKRALPGGRTLSELAQEVLPLQNFNKAHIAHKNLKLIFPNKTVYDRQSIRVPMGGGEMEHVARGNLSGVHPLNNQENYEKFTGERSREALKGILKTLGLGGAGAAGVSTVQNKLGAEKRAALTYVLRGHLKQALLAGIQTAVRGH